MLISTILVVPSLFNVRSYFIPLPVIAGVMACDEVLTIAEEDTIGVGGDGGSDACPAVNASDAESSEEATTAERAIPMLVLEDKLSSAKTLLVSCVLLLVSVSRSPL
eukprot:CAMPEP_0197279344 /NCGR_PEP_ID=MMETSP1432-20130617/19968_1 /TAXON_ID=44447 /ORGANISM="Pseudo-nitzschia delicatissima, Strain UNC1205" /LENGTH=106 /DNA_ID=CAMNT_0042745871 /DNA_START=266 /DNA_END=582 /DNA_ORIENTATION=+